ncbi:MAG TPA: hypothetical protein VGR08_03495, partial [Thermomicrobiales bacterium]|nr:hypothetical protein [Thermomicrobiales bacterium]
MKRTSWWHHAGVPASPRNAGSIGLGNASSIAALREQGCRLAGRLTPDVHRGNPLLGQAAVRRGLGGGRSGRPGPVLISAAEQDGQRFGQGVAGAGKSGDDRS